MPSVRSSADAIGFRVAVAIGFLSMAIHLFSVGMSDMWLSILTSISIALFVGYAVSFSVFTYEYIKVREIDLHLIWDDYKFFSEVVDDNGSAFSELMKSYREARK